MSEKQPKVPPIEIVRSTLEENGFIEFTRGARNLPGIVQEIISNPKYGLLFGTKNVFDEVNKSSTRGVIVLYDHEKVEAMRFNPKKKNVSVEEEEKRDFYKRHIVALSLSGYPVINTSHGVVFLKPVEEQEELQSA